MSIQRIGLGGGCYWCTEAVFQSLRGVTRVTQGFACANPPYDLPSEAVLIEFESDSIALLDIIRVHLRTHASASEHSMRGKYRSAIYAYDSEQQRECDKTLASLQHEYSEKLITQTLMLTGFKAADEKYRDYYRQNRDNQFCLRYIDPKLDTLNRDFSDLLHDRG